VERPRTEKRSDVLEVALSEMSMANELPNPWKPTAGTPASGEKRAKVTDKTNIE